MLQNFKNIQAKLEAFIRRYYTNELIKGSILFFGIGLLYFLFTLLIEHFLWLSPIGRTILFWLFVAVEALLFIQFIALPFSKLIKLQKGIDYEDASRIIGEHFPEVNDKLLNVIQLQQSASQSELLLASIEQKSIELKLIPFKLAINFKKNIKYLKYAVIPVLILLLASVSGRFNLFSDSYERVVNYKTAYEPPAPFQFYVLNENLQATENKDFKLIIKAAGEVLPENAQITYNNETYFLQQKAIGDYEYVISKPKQDITFQLSANKVTSKPYTIKVIEAPTLLYFDMVLNYPSHTKMQDEILKSTGNAVVPQGTKITWKLHTKATERVRLYTADTLEFQTNSKGVFEASKRVYKNLKYQLTTSNKNLKDYEKLAFNIDVIKDEYPELNLKMQVDSLDQQSLYFYGQVSDDYGLSKLQMVYYPTEDEKNKTVKNIPINNANVADFISAFPDNLELKEGVSYELYFQVFDNDEINKYKSTKSEIFSYIKLTKDEEEQKQLQEQKETIKDLNETLESFKEREKELQELSKTQKEKATLNFNDKRKLDNFLKRQKQQEEMMKNFNKQLKENLEEFQKENEELDTFKEDLKERLKENEEQFNKDEKLLEELEKLQEKIDKEELSDKLEELSKQNKSQKRSLEQLLELTKKYYVAKKLEKLQQELEKLAEKQEKLSEESPENNTKEKQDELNKEFEEFQKEMDALEKENQELRQPEKIDRDLKEEEIVKEDQQEASDKLEEKKEQEEQKKTSDSQKSAKQKQKQAAEKMKEMSKKMQAAMSASSGERIAEDVTMLRQILDNLLLFSFDQESLMDQFQNIEINHNKYASLLRKQHHLREHFSHVDDSLFALSIRQPKISERVNKEIHEVFYNIDKSLGEFSENQIYKGVSRQQYVITSANNLADFLSNILENMQMQMSGQGSGGEGQPKPGQGQGDGGLPDIIKSQEELAKEMQEGIKKGDKGKKEGEDGEKGKDGESGKENGEGGSKQGEGEGNSEQMNGEIYRIYQQQQQLRQALQDMLNKKGLNGAGNNLLKEMEQIELDLLNKGFTNKTLEKMMHLKHELLKLEEAVLEQGQEEKREAQTNKKQFDNKTKSQIPTAKQYFNTTEILNRQSLPLQPIYKKKVQEYFKQKDD
ncbi:DUF4175 family protein [Oceanihabitans sediminis]|uniref:DUF4175 family protein n=1 Tax=Oceanihabitans sediminis TaxID=1812012 RepID=UPI00299E7762|nr:DUF4175 family protein [Oceanihabitans sediminis]MDX1278691.1 DUF4175 family protein [Oceanihabitans sediminis]